MQVLEISRDGYLGLLESDGELNIQNNFPPSIIVVNEGTVRKDVKLPRGELGESIQEQFEDGSIIEVRCHVWTRCTFSFKKLISSGCRSEHDGRARSG